MVKSSEIDVTTIHHVKGTSLDWQVIQHRDIVRFPVCNANKAGNVAAQIGQRMKLDRSFFAAKFCPRKQAQAQVDGRRVERICRVFQRGSKFVPCVQFASVCNQHLGKIGEDSPIVCAVGIGQSTPRNPTPKSRVIEFVLNSAKAGFDVAQALAKRELPER